MPENLVAAEIIHPPPQKIKGGATDIVHATAPHAPHVVVRLDIAVESGLDAAHIELLNQARSGEQFQVAIYSPQADLGESAADEIVHPHRRGVRCELLEFFQNHLSLPGVALESGVFHGT